MPANANPLYLPRNPAEVIKDFLDYLRRVEETKRMAEQEQRDCDDKTQDILHALELEQTTYRERALMTTELAETRKNRRVAKDALERCGTLYAWINNNRAVIGDLQRLLGDMRKTETRLANRQYTPKCKG